MVPIEIELRDHVGVYNNPLTGPVEIKHDQWMVIAKTEVLPQGAHIGYLGHKPGSPFNGLGNFSDFPEVVKNAVLEAIEKKCGWQLRSYLANNNAWPGSEEDDEDESDDDTDVVDDGD